MCNHLTARPTPIPPPSVPQQAAALYAEGRLSAALAVIGPPDAQPDAFLLNLAAACHIGLGHPEAAIFCWQQAIRHQPDFADAHCNLGNLLKSLHRYAEAESAYRQALRCQPADADAHNSLGDLLQGQNRPAEAETAYRHALRHRPNDAAILNNLGTLLHEMDRPAEAEATFRQALASAPDTPQVHSNLGNLLYALHRMAEAEAAYRQAVQLQPDYADAHSNLGLLLQEAGRSGEAEAAYRQALRHNPHLADAHYNLGRLLKELGRLAEAEQSYRQALACNPDHLHAHSGLLFAQNYRAETPIEVCLADARHYGERVAALAQPFHHQPKPADRHRTLRIGLVSGDLRHHPVGYFLESVVAHLHPTEVTLFAYDTAGQEDGLTQRFRRLIPHWRTVTHLSDAALAQQIHADGIDILLDLAGHTRHNRLSLFAWKPAPVQVAWLGYFATTGVAAIDYILGDAINLPAGEADHFTEKPWHLPDCYLCFTPPDFSLPVAPLPALSTGGVTFGCFNHASKITTAVLTCWAHIVQAVPNSRLLLKHAGWMDPVVRRGLLEKCQQANLAWDRLLLEGAETREGYLACYNRVDMALDPFPYPGGTTSVEGLWMGVPVLTRQGNRFLSHQGETLLRAAGLSAWIAADEADYLRKAIAFASDLPRLASLRAGLRPQLLQSPLCDAPRFARHLTQAWQEMWAIWCGANLI
ncbi:MAG: tetratricopeptide repeat protein [Magnetococcales bacterium]|nr:tetratricopeptide repeat protein [Magnetococcales bacterium]